MPCSVYGQTAPTAPGVRVVRFSQIHPEPEGGAKRNKLRSVALEAKTRAVTHNQDCILVIHGRLVGRDVQRVVVSREAVELGLER